MALNNLTGPLVDDKISQGRQENALFVFCFVFGKKCTKIFLSYTFHSINCWETHSETSLKDKD